jgi:hypothetical protein
MTDDNTPPRSPSAQQRIGLAVCVVCDCNGFVRPPPDQMHSFAVQCPECHGARRVTLERHHELVGLKPHEADAGRKQ